MQHVASSILVIGNSILGIGNYFQIEHKQPGLQPKHAEVIKKIRN